MRGTTPNVTFKISLKASEIAKAKISFKQGSVLLLIKHTDDLEIEDGKVTATLSRAETLRFPDNATVRMQLEIETPEGKNHKTKVYNRHCSELLSPEVLR